MDHNDLIAELPRIEKLPASERLKIARERRAQQLLRYDRHDSQHVGRKHRDQSSSVHFVHSVVLLEAAARNDIEEVRRLLAQGVDPDSQNEDGLTALHQCCIDNSESMMRLLLEFGANVNAEDSERWTPLHAAATCGHLHLVQYLIAKGANLLAVNADGNMPYDICEDEATLDFIESEMAKRGVTQKLIDDTRASTERKMLMDLKELARRGESLELEDSTGARPLHIAAANGYLSVVEFLLDQHVTTDCRDHDGWQPIHAAACWGHLEVLELLVQNGSDLNALTNSHETPFDICEDPEMKSRIAALRSEQESRARADHHRNRRTQASSNTRTHSIRRNSTRDKGQISKKHIKNEAICGIQNGGTQDLKRQSAHDSLDLTSVPAGDQNQAVIGDAGRPFNPLSNESASWSNEMNRNELRGDPQCRVLSTSPVLTATCVNENTIDIRVSVTINAFKETKALVSPQTSSTSVVPAANANLPQQPLTTYLDSIPSFGPGACTLADLKKQRSLSRVSGLNLPVEFVPTIADCNPVLSNFFILPESGVNGGPEVPYLPKSAPKKEGALEAEDSGKVPVVQKFQGETAELVGSDNSGSSCCVVS